MKVNTINIQSLNIQINVQDRTNTDSVTTEPVYDSYEDIKADTQESEPTAINESFEETLVTLAMELIQNATFYEKIRKGESAGKFGVITLIRKWAREFEFLHLHNKWENADFYEEIDNFLLKKFKSYPLDIA